MGSNKLLTCGLSSWATKVSCLVIMCNGRAFKPEYHVIPSSLGVMLSKNKKKQNLLVIFQYSHQLMFRIY